MGEHPTREVRGVVVVDVAESYSRETFLKLLALARELATGDSPRVLLNMTRLVHITSEGIGILVVIHDQCETAGGRMALCSVPERVEHVLRIAGVVHFFKIYPGEEDAVAALAKEGAGAAAGAAPSEELEEEPAELDPAQLAEAARDVVRTVIRSRRHHEVIEFFGKRTVKVASLDEIADSLRVPRLTAELVMRDLAGKGLVVEEGEVFLWHPSPEAERKLALFRRALGTPSLRSRVMAWLYAEEKK